MKKRLFIAVDLAEKQRRELAFLMDRLQALSWESQLKIHWIPPENLHLTLKFLGAAPVDRIPMICEKLEAAARAFAPFEVSLTSVGMFEKSGERALRKAPLWLGIADPPQGLKVVFKCLEFLLEPLGFEKESREFWPHLTLARISSDGQVEPQSILRKLLAKDPAIRLQVRTELPEVLRRIQVGALVLYESETLPSGSKYRALARFELKLRIL
jgi:2'-5' RNA ligase